MKTKEAIEFLEECQDENIELQEKGHDELLIKVINLLKRGEKFEAIFNTILNWTMNDGEFIPYNDLVDLEQKYFPKEK